MKPPNPSHPIRKTLNRFAVSAAFALLAVAPSASAQLTSNTTSAGGRTIVTFTAGTGTWTVPSDVSAVDVLVVGGGGGGGANSGGGGGAGGVRYQTGVSVTPGANLPVTVGGGGIGGVNGGIAPGNGAASIFSTFTAIGGGKGGSYASSASPAGAGGSGGGGFWGSSAGGSGTVGQGNNGGTQSGSPGAGGGGAAAAGLNGSGRNGGNGGAGIQYSISGTATYYGGGAGGGADKNGQPTVIGLGGFGGLGGGGKGSDSTGTGAAAGTANTGGGGGGGSNPGVTLSGAAGGSGVVIVSYALPPNKLAFSAVSPGLTAGQPFSVTVQAQDVGNSPQNVTSDTTVTLSKTAGAGTLGGTLSGTITSGTNSIVIPGLTYSVADMMTLQVAVSSGMSLTSATTNLTFSSVPQVLTPTFSPVAGAYVGAQSVTISCGTPGSTVYYTTDGNDPTTSSPNGGVGTSSASVNVPVSTTQTIKAFATRSGYLDSTIASATYTTVSSPTWTNTAGGSWPVTGNWQAGLVGQGAGVTANFSTLTLPGTTTVTLDSSPTIGSLIFGDVGNTNSWNINAGTVTLANGLNTPTITVDNQTTTFAAPLAGASGFVKAGAGKLVLGAANTFTGGAVTIQEGILQLNGPVLNGSKGQLNDVTTITVEDGGTLLAKYGDAIGYTSGIAALVIHGGAVTNDSNSAFSLCNPLNMVGGSLVATGTGWITITPVTQVINATSDASGNPAVISGVQVQQNANSVFSVTRGPLTPASDLNVNSILNRGGSGYLSVSGNGIMTLSGNNTYQGNTIANAGVTLKLASTGRLTIKPTTNGNTNKVTGTGTVILDGGLVIDLTTAVATNGNEWILVDVGTLAETYDTNFQVVDFTQTTPGVWTKTHSPAGTWTFTTATGKLKFALSAYDIWANGTFTPPLTQKLSTDNQDGDTLNNLQEFAFGTQPTVATGEIVYSGGTLTTPGAPKVVAAAGTYSMVFGRRADYVAAGLTYTVQFSAGLDTWVDNDDGTNPPVQVATDGTINAMSVPFVDFITTPSGTQKPTFSRVKVVLAP